MTEHSSHNPNREQFEPTSSDELDQGMADLQRLLRDASTDTPVVDEIPAGTFDSNDAPADVNNLDDTGERQLTYKERRELDPASLVVDRAKYLRQAYFRQQFEQNWESATGSKDERNAAARAAADNAIADMTAIDGYPELISLRDKLRTEKREPTGGEKKFLRFIREEEKYYAAAAGIRFNGRGGLFDAGKGEAPSIDAARSRIEDVKAKLQQEFEAEGSPEAKREKFEADIAALDFYVERVGQSQVHTNEDWHASEFLETQERAQGKPKKSAERKQANVANSELDTRFDEYGKASRALTLLSKHDDRLAKRENTMKPKSDESLTYVAVLDEPLSVKKDDADEEPSVRITQLTANKNTVDADLENDGDTDEEEDEDEAEEVDNQTQPVAPVAPAAPVNPVVPPVVPPANPINPNQQHNPNQNQQVPAWLQNVLDQMNQTQQALLANMNNQQQFMQGVLQALGNIQNNPNQQQANPNQQQNPNPNQQQPPAQGAQQPPAQPPQQPPQPPAGGGPNPNQNQQPSPEELVTSELDGVRDALALEKSKTWRNTRLGRLAWRMMGGIMGPNSRAGRTYRNLEDLESRYSSLNEQLFTLKEGGNLNGLTPDQIATKQSKFIFDEQEALRKATREIMTEKRRMRRIGNWVLSHKKWVIGGSVIMMPFTGGMSLGVGLGALAGFKSDQKFSGMRDTITKMNANEVKRVIQSNGGDFGAGMRMSMDRFDEDISWENFKRSGAIALGITAFMATGIAEAFAAAQIKSMSFEGLGPWMKAHTIHSVPSAPDLSVW